MGDRVVELGRGRLHCLDEGAGPAIARLAPERVRGLVLLNPSNPNAGSLRDRPALLRERWYQQFHLLPLAGHLIDGDRRQVARYLGHFYERWAGVERIEPADLARVVDVYARPGAFRSSIAWYAARAARYTQGDVPSAVDLPTIALWGDRDPLRPLELREGFEDAFPCSSCRLLRGVGHFIPAEAPDEVVAAIADLLETTASATVTSRSLCLPHGGGGPCRPF